MAILTTNIPSQLQKAMIFFNNGQLADADYICQEILRVFPDNSYAIQLSGVIAHNTGQLEKAEFLLEKASSLRSGAADILNSLGLVLSDQGRHDEAICRYKEALNSKRDYAEAYNNLGVSYECTGRYAEACNCYLSAHKIAPANTEFLSNLANVCIKSGDNSGAIDIYTKLLLSDPRNSDVHYHLANAYYSNENSTEAEEHYRKALALSPRHCDALVNLSILLQHRGNYKEAIQLLNLAALIKPNDPNIYYNLGTYFQLLGDLHNAAKQYKHAISIKPDNYLSLCNLGVTMLHIGNASDAENCFRDAIKLNDTGVNAYINLATLLHKKGEFEQALQYYQHALVLEPENAAIYYNIGNAFVEQSKIDESLIYYRKSLDINPNDPEVFSNYLYAQNYSASLSPGTIYQNHLEYSQQFQKSFSKINWHNHRKRDKTKKLCVGYVSADFREHPIAFFIEPILANHDSESFEIFCYYNNNINDTYTKRLRSLSNHWINTASMNDDEVAEHIVADKIDILVDLGGHTGKNRLLVFARKPAPIQITWLGYLNTTGLREMDYRLTDEIACPHGDLDLYHTEALIRIPGCQWCYMPPTGAPEISSLPAAKNGYLTFASFHNIAKISIPVISLWCRILDEIPDSRLVIVGKGVDISPAIITERFTELGISPERLETVGRMSFIKYLELHNRVDICLDTFPYSGGTTTCHSLWMGVPVITLIGNSAVSRGTASLLNMVGLSRMTANTADEYVNIAKTYASNLTELSILRKALRKRMNESALVDGAGFCRKLENIYVKAWNEYNHTSCI